MAFRGLSQEFCVDIKAELPGQPSKRRNQTRHGMLSPGVRNTKPNSVSIPALADSQEECDTTEEQRGSLFGPALLGV